VSHDGESVLAFVEPLRIFPTAGYAPLFLFSPEHNFRHDLERARGPVASRWPRTIERRRLPQQSMTAGLLERLDALAEQQGWNRSQTARKAVQTLVKRRER
jgi:hypothetical protein